MQTQNMKATMESLRTMGFVCDGCSKCRAPVCPRCLDENPGTPGGSPDAPHTGPFTAELCDACEAVTRLTLDEKTAIGHSYDRGNYDSAYAGQEINHDLVADMKPHNRAAYVLGFFSSYTLDEMCSEDREIFDECYFTPVGQYIVHVVGYCDDRADEYAAEEC